MLLRRWWALGDRWAAYGLAGVIATFVGVSVYYALSTPPFLPRDEQAHLGYAHAVAHGDLPEIDTFHQIPNYATEWQARSDANPDDRYRQVWVANHPPLNYVLLAPSIWTADLIERPDGGLMFVRLTNVAFAAGGLVFVYLLTCEISRGNTRLGVLAASMVALLPQPPVFYARGFNDGLAFLTITFLLWSAARLLRRGTSRSGVALMSAAVSIACLARASGLLVSLVVVATVLAVGLWHEVEHDVGRLWSQLWRHILLGLALVGPAVVTSGWFYARNTLLYGDIGASSFLLDRFDRERRGSMWSLVFDASWIESLFTSLATRPLAGVFTDQHGLIVRLALVLSAVGLVALVAPPLKGLGLPRRMDSFDVSKPTVVVSLAAAAIVILAMAQHVSGGGLPHLRYLYPVLGPLAALMVIGLDRVARFLPTLLVAAQGLVLYPRVGQTSEVLRNQIHGMSTGLQFVPSSSVTRGLALSTAVVGGVILTAVLTSYVVEPRLSRRFADVPASPPASPILREEEKELSRT